MNRQHNTLADFVKKGMELRFPKKCMVYMDGERVLYTPLPSHFNNLRTKINGVHNKSTHKERGENLEETLLFYL